MSLIDLSTTSGLIKLAAIPLISALIGWLTNALAVKMIFRPHRPIRILGLTIQGLVPKRQGDLAHSIGKTVERHLISHNDVMDVLNAKESLQALNGMVRERISTFLKTKLVVMNPLIGAFMSPSLMKKIEGTLVEEFEALAPEMIGKMMERMEDKLDFQAIVEEKVRGFDLDRLEQIIFEIASRELKAIEILGGVLGFIIGIIQVGLILL